jgi:hypothetical protein
MQQVGYQQCEGWKKALTTSSTATSFATKIPTITPPTGVGVIDMSAANFIPHFGQFLFYGAGADDTTFDVRLIAWNPIGTAVNNVLWIPQVLCSLTCILGTSVGIAGASVIDTDRFADSIVVHATVAPQPTLTDVVSAAAATRGTIEIFLPSNNLIAYAQVPLRGARKLEVSFDMTGATNGNALYRFLSK